MSAVVDTYRDGVDVSYAVDFGRDRDPVQKRSRFPEYRRKGGPAQVNGIHRRRSKRWTWGSGRGARMLNMRAFAGSLAFAVASLSAAAFGVTIDYGTVGNPGNSANTNSWGAVSDTFKISKYETTNQQYKDFLNAVDSAGTNPNGIYNSQMGSDSIGGITFNAGASPGSKYAVKGGSAPSGAAYGTMPVVFTNWWSAARFVNWIENGQGSGGTETGAYTLANKTSGPIVARNAGAKNFLPSRDEWYKSGFYNGSGYTTWQTNSNTQPTNTITNLTLANAANYGFSSTPTTNPIAVGAYVNTTSAYGMYDMLGNVREWVQDFYSPTAYQQSIADGPAGPKDGKVHVARGGFYDSPAGELRCAARAFEEDWWRMNDPQIPKSKWWLPQIDSIGFRVACEVPKGK